MANLKSIKKRIVSVKNTRQITKAMKMVSAAKLRRAQENVVAARPYARKLGEVLQSLAGNLEGDQHPLLEKRDAKKLLLIVVTSDRGLCGGFNHALCKTLDRWCQEQGGDRKPAGIFARGRRGFQFFRHHMPIVKSYEEKERAPSYETACRMAEDLTAMFLSGKADAIHIAYNTCRGVGSHIPVVERLLPVEWDAAAVSAIPADASAMEPSAAELLEALLPMYVASRVHVAQTISMVGEQSARMISMESATNNADKLIDSYTTQRNQARQAAITSELVEIVAGAEALASM